MKIPQLCCCTPNLDDNLLKIMQRSTTELEKVKQRETIMCEIDRGAEIEFLNIDNFQIKEKLGSGRFSEVYLLERNHDKRKFAAKLFKVDVGSRDFIRETTIMNSCSKECVNIVKMYGIIPIPKCLVMDYYKNGSLYTALQEDSKRIQLGHKTEFPFIRRLGYILDLCRAVTDLHRRNICHRDIAMRNLLLSDDKQHVLLTDFSISRVVKSAIARQSTLSSIVPIQSAPETISNEVSSTPGLEIYERWYSLKSDIWSIGITMYGIIDKGFSKINEWRQLPSRIPKESIPPPDVFDRINDLWILILRCWNETPERRPQSLDLEERIEHLKDNPFNVANENEGYISYQTAKCTLNGVYVCEDAIPNSDSPATMSEDKVFEHELPISCGSMKLDLVMSSNFEELESSDSPRCGRQTRSSHIFPRTATAGMGERCRSRLERKQGVCKAANYEHGSKEFLSTLRCKVKTRSHSLSPNLSPNNTSSNTSLSTYISDPSMVNDGPTGNRGFKFLKRLGSLSTMVSPSVNSAEGLQNRVWFCSPLHISDRSSATNIASCPDASFFKKSVGKLMSNERPSSSEYLLAPDLGTADENSGSSCKIVTPNFQLICK